MKVLFVLENTIQNLEGGTEVSSWHLVRLLKQRGIEVEEWAPFRKRKSPFWYTSAFGQLYIFIVLLWKLVKNRVQIIHIQGKYLIPPVILVSKLLNIPTVATIRDYIVICPIGLCLFDSVAPHDFRFFIKKEIPHFLLLYHYDDGLIIRIVRYILLIRGGVISAWICWWLRKANAVISVSEAVQKILSKNSISSEVIYNSFDTEFTEEIQFLKTLSNRILFVGKTSYGKGYDLFAALSRRKEFAQYEFKTVGGGQKLGYRSTLSEIRRAFVVIVPSRWQEPFGRVALESLMIGIPVIVTNKGGLPEIVDHNITGYVAEPTVASLREFLAKAIVKNSMLRKQIMRKRQFLLKKFETIPVEKHISLYRNLLFGKM